MDEQQKQTSPTSETESGRAVEAYDSLPADSEAKVDYPPGTVVNQTFLPKMEPVPYYELGVEISINLPDGTRLNYSEAVEKKDADDYDFDEVDATLWSALRVMRKRLGQPD